MKQPEPELEKAIGWFRGAIDEWSRTEPLAPWQPQSMVRGAMPRPSRVRPARWVLIAATIAATLVILAGVPIYRNVERQRVVEQARADALLWEQVDAGLSRPVPAPMEPLLSLVPGDIR